MLHFWRWNNILSPKLTLRQWSNFFIASSFTIVTKYNFVAINITWELTLGDETYLLLPNALLLETKWYFVANIDTLGDKISFRRQNWNFRQWSNCFVASSYTFGDEIKFRCQNWHFRRQNKYFVAKCVFLSVF